MSHRLSLVLVVLGLAALACNTPGAQGQPPASQVEPEVIVVTATNLPATSAPPGGVRTPLPPAPLPPTALPPAAAPSFSHNINFAETADVSQATGIFHEGTTRVYALWTYSNMTAALTIRRDWFLDGALWITREEPWNFANYGANGIVTDISIYDTQNGLPSGHYELKLYIDNQPQFTASDDPALRSFDIVKGADGGN